MTRVYRSAMLPFEPAQLFALVKDVERYPEFLPWCTHARVVATGDDEVVAELTLARGGVVERFTTRNHHTADRQIDLQFVDGPFDSLAGRWLFTGIGDSGTNAGTKMELHLDFEFSRALVQRLFGAVFTQAANTLVDAFCQRANQLLRT